MILFILTNTITLILLPILYVSALHFHIDLYSFVSSILVEFRVWLDAARLLLLFVLQAGASQEYDTVHYQAQSIPSQAQPLQVPIGVLEFNALTKVSL